MDFHIKDLLRLYQPRKPIQQTRGMWIKKFYRKVMPGWNENMPNPLTFKELAIRMINVPLAEMETLWKLCEDSTSFDKFFWWRIKRYPRRKKEKKPKQLHF